MSHVAYLIYGTFKLDKFELIKLVKIVKSNDSWSKWKYPLPLNWFSSGVSLILETSQNTLRRKKYWGKNHLLIISSLNYFSSRSTVKKSDKDYTFTWWSYVAYVISFDMLCPTATSKTCRSIPYNWHGCAFMVLPSFEIIWSHNQQQAYQGVSMYLIL